jgi:hypothetical protein
VYALLLAMPVAFVAGRATDPSRFTIRQAEAAPAPRDLPAGIVRLHDASNEVTCWLVSGRVADSGYATTGLSCLPDQWLASARIEDTP